MTRRPNILMIMSDQEQHWDLLPDGLKRPGIEALLETGTAFARHHVVTLPCGPSRSTIYTGQHIQRTRVFRNPGPFPGGAGMSPDVPTIGTILRGLGYHTAYKGKWHISHIENPPAFAANTVRAVERYGFADYTPDGDPVGIAWDGYRRDPSVASDAANWLLGRGGSKPADRPWFLAVNFVNPHDVMFFDATGSMNDVGGMAVPRLPPPADPLYLRDWEVALPESFRDDLSGKPPVQTAMRQRINQGLGTIGPGDERAWRALRSYYYNCLQDLDRHVQTVLSALGRSGHDDDTVIVYTSDHGEAAGAHGLREKPVSLYREVVNVPLIIRHPDVRGASTCASPTSAIDLARTMAMIAGGSQEILGERHPKLAGYNLCPLIEGAASRGPRAELGVLFCMPGSAAWRSSPPGATVMGTLRRLELPNLAPEVAMCGLYDGRWKLAAYNSQNLPRPGDSEGVPAEDLELYDTLTDPHELTNLALDSSHRAKIDALLVRMRRQLASEHELPGHNAMARR